VWWKKLGYTSAPTVEHRAAPIVVDAVAAVTKTAVATKVPGYGADKEDMTDAQKLIYAGYTDGDLDEIVCSAASRLAREANSGGIEEQVRFLFVNGMGLDEIVAELGN
jgi:hypothetical protein